MSNAVEPGVVPDHAPTPSDIGLYMGGAFALLFNRLGEVLLLMEGAAKRKYEWDLPGGTLNPAEEPVDGLRREVREETGLELKLITRFCYLKYDRHESGIPILVAFYLAEAVGEQVRLSREHVGYRWVDEATIDSEGIELPPGSEQTAMLFALYRQLRTK